MSRLKKTANDPYIIEAINNFGKNLDELYSSTIDASLSHILSGLSDEDYEVISGFLTEYNKNIGPQIARAAETFEKEKQRLMEVLQGLQK